MPVLLNPAELFKALADETRTRIALLMTREGELCVCELTVALDLSQPKISRHLALLRGCGLLLDRRQGQWIYYRLHPELPNWISELLQSTSQANGQWLMDDVQRLQGMHDRPLRCC
ncbi:metalloregulator ArsR/SmtB family transcription factor [Pseudomonas sp. LD120]|uniref:metalloregulator ArsR/SmtB family transcription factor n=1 Tax=Pseudomonas sp. LD120 TaxID=485751 RepID=UPI00135CF701|nr:metalloregulator ArsR/SmtB family transcription factor [Pseudomonas sp. LD120]KAF0866806.1 metalloregulator ArsR/SmtB family transcription factor [Pseudomonas sp. LD120]